MKKLTQDYRCPIPEYYYIDISNVCNLKCPFCQTGQRTKGFTRSLMSKEKYKVLLEKIAPYAKQVHMYNWGEPFLNEDIVPIIRMTADRGIFIVVHSNLSSQDFSDSEAEDIVRSGLSFLNVALDGASQETYEKYRRGGNFHRVFENMKKIQLAKKKLNIEMPVNWQFLVNVYNEHEIEKAREMATDLGVILTTTLMNVDEVSWDSSYHKFKDTKKLPGALNSDQIPAETFARPKSPVELHPEIPDFCNQPFLWMNVCPSGSVIPCSAMQGDHYILGNIFESDIEDIWQGEGYRKCRQFLANYGPEQSTGSVCEKFPCHLRKKFIEGINGLALADLTAEFVTGIWEEPGGEWYWLSNEAKVDITPKKNGNLTFDLIFPEGEVSKNALPLEVEVSAGEKLVQTLHWGEPGQKLVEIPVAVGNKFSLKITSDKSVIPEEVCGNGDTRKLSLVLRNFCVQ